MGHYVTNYVVGVLAFVIGVFGKRLWGFWEEALGIYMFAVWVWGSGFG